MDSPRSIGPHATKITGKRNATVPRPRTVKAPGCGVQAGEQIPLDQQRLSYAGRTLEDSSSLANYAISQDATLDLGLRLRWGLRVENVYQTENYNEQCTLPLLLPMLEHHFWTRPRAFLALPQIHSSAGAE